MTDAEHMRSTVLTPHSELEIFQQQTSHLPFVCTCWNPVSSQESNTSFLFLGEEATTITACLILTF